MRSLSQNYETELRVLEGLRLRGISLAADMLCLQFGKLHEIPNGKGGIGTVGEWALHIQVPWRFVRNSEITLALRDVYQYADGNDDYDWHKGGESRFHKLAKEFNAELEEQSFLVTSIVCDHVGGFSLEFGSQARFDVFPNISWSMPDCEFWRLLQRPGDNDHFVFGTESTVGEL